MPRIHNPMLVKTFEAEVAVTKGMTVIAGTDEDQVNDPAAANDVPVGIALHAAAAGEQVDVCMFGPAIGIADAAITRGALVAIGGALGKLAPITGGSTTFDQRVVGKALEAAAADGDEISIFVGLNDGILV